MRTNDFTWGIDIGVKRIAFGVSSGHTGVLELARSDGAKRLSDAHAAIYEHAHYLANHFPPFVVFVEEGGGRFHNRPLAAMASICQAAVYSALETRYPFPVSVLSITPPAWKKQSLGNGAATKEQVAIWARAQGCEATTQDELDAFCIAYAGERMTKPVAA